MSYMLTYVDFLKYKCDFDIDSFNIRHSVYLGKKIKIT